MEIVREAVTESCVYQIVLVGDGVDNRAWRVRGGVYLAVGENGASFLRRGLCGACS